MDITRSSNPSKIIESFQNRINGLRLNKDVENLISNADNINSLYNELNNYVMELDKTVGVVLKKHEVECLKNYKEKMYNLQKEIRLLKDKANEEENNRRKQRKISELEIKRDQLKEKAENLDKVCKEQKRSVDKWKMRAEEMVDDKKFYEEQLETALKQQETLKEQLLALESQKSIEVPEDEIPSQQKIQIPYNANPNYFTQVSHRIKETIGHMYSQLEAERKNLRNLKNAKTNFMLEKGELEDLFLVCVEDVKRDILGRKLKASRNVGKARRISDKEKQIDFSEFKEIDKRKVMENFLNSEKVRKFLYDKMFGIGEESQVTLENVQFTGKSARTLNKSRSSSKPASSNGLLSHIFSKPRFSPETKSLHRPNSVPPEPKNK